MAEVLNYKSGKLWPVDWVILTYFGSLGVIIPWLARRIPGAWWLVLLHAIAIIVVIAAIKFPSRVSMIFRHWYPLPYVSWCYREMAVLVPAIRGRDYDAELAYVDFRIWGVNPTVWLERISTRVLTEYMQIVYTAFIPAVLLIAFLLWRQRRYAEFRFYAFLVALGFLVSYVGYVLVPARGPRFFLHSLQTTELRGLWFTAALRLTLDRLETRAFDCFPSGHTELTLLACWISRALSKRLFWIYFVYTLSLISATVYLRYHYTIDVLAGVVVAGLLVLFAPPLYRSLEKGSA